MIETARELQRLFPTTRAGRASGRADNINTKVKELRAAKEDVDSMRGRYLTAEQRQMVVRVHIHVLEQRLERRKRKKASHGTNNGDALDVTAAYTGVSRTAVAAAWKDYQSGKVISGFQAATAKAAAASAASATRIKESRELVGRVRAFVRNFHAEHRQCTSVEVTLHMIEHGDLFVNNPDGTRKDATAYSDKEMAAARRCVQRWLVDHGWQRGKANAKTKMKETPELRAHRAEYLKVVQDNRNGKKLREVFTDESYMNRHYHTDSLTLYDPSDKKDKGTRKHMFKGQRHLFVGAIAGPNLHMSEDERKQTLDDMGGWISDVYASFEAPLGRGKKDYHTCFSAAWYETWFTKLCTVCHKLFGPCLIILDNVSFHKRTNFNNLKKLRKADLIKALRAGSSANGHDPTFWDRFPTKTALVHYLQQVAGCGLMEPNIIGIARKFGHKVAFTPPYHSDLQPIEMVWANAKQQVARGYHNGTTMEETMERLVKAFSEITPRIVYGCYKKSLVSEDKARKIAEEDETVEEEEEEDEEEASVSI